jgi:hypothetical protein
MVLPGDELTRAKLFRFSNLLITDDLPTFDLPEKTICGIGLSIRSFAFAADFMNSALLIFIILVFN